MSLCRTPFFSLADEVTFVERDLHTSAFEFGLHAIGVFQPHNIIPLRVVEKYGWMCRRYVIDGGGRFPRFWIFLSGDAH